jgi:predicted DsbA family dithiol-disulfide isomerase
MDSRTRNVKVDVGFDLVCPWCLLGKRRFEAALERFEHRDAVHVHWRSFELDPDSSGQGELTIPQCMRCDLGVTREQARRIGISGVPSFVFEDRYVLSGARTAEAFHRTLTEMWR